MSSVVYAVPYSPPPPPTLPFRGYRHVFTGWDGSVWDLSDPDGGVVLVTGGVGGLAMPTFDTFTSSSAAVPGSTWLGSRAQERAVEWPLLVYSDVGSEDWVERFRAFFRTMNPERPGVWSVTDPFGRTRSLSVRFKSDGDHTYDVDPAEAGWGLYQLQLVAVDPFWQGPAVESTWGQEEAAVWFTGPADEAPPLYVMGASTLASAAVDNPGDEPSWPVWTVQGPTTSVDLVLDGETVGVPFAVLEGQTLVIATDPRGQVALLDGVDVTGELDPYDFAPVPTGRSELAVTMAGSGRVSIRFTPNFHQAL